MQRGARVTSALWGARTVMALRCEHPRRNVSNGIAWSRNLFVASGFVRVLQGGGQDRLRGSVRLSSYIGRPTESVRRTEAT